MPPCPEGMNSVNFEVDVRNPVQMRVCNVLKKWIVTRYDQDLAHKPEVIEELTQFIGTAVKRDSEYLADNLQQCLSLYISGERFQYHRKLAQGIVDRPMGSNSVRLFVGFRMCLVLYLFIFLMFWDFSLLPLSF